MKLLKSIKSRVKFLVVFVGVTAVFSLPGLVRCSGEVDSRADDSRFASLTVNR